MTRSREGPPDFGATGETGPETKGRRDEGDGRRDRRRGQPESTTSFSLIPTHRRSKSYSEKGRSALSLSPKSSFLVHPPFRRSHGRGNRERPACFAAWVSSWCFSRLRPYSCPDRGSTCAALLRRQSFLNSGVCGPSTKDKNAVLFIVNRKSYSQAGRRQFESRLPLHLFLCLDRRHR